MGIVVVLAIVGIYLWAIHSVAPWISFSSISADLPQVGDAVETLQKIELDGGTIVPRKYVTKVLATDVTLQTPVVEIDIDGRKTWVARTNVKKL